MVELRVSSIGEEGWEVKGEAKAQALRQEKAKVLNNAAAAISSAEGKYDYVSTQRADPQNI